MTSGTGQCVTAVVMNLSQAESKSTPSLTGSHWDALKCNGTERNVPKGRRQYFGYSDGWQNSCSHHTRLKCPFLRGAAGRFVMKIHRESEFICFFSCLEAPLLSRTVGRLLFWFRLDSLLALGVVGSDSREQITTFDIYLTFKPTTLFCIKTTLSIKKKKKCRHDWLSHY